MNILRFSFLTHTQVHKQVAIIRLVIEMMMFRSNSWHQEEEDESSDIKYLLRPGHSG